MVSEIVCNVGQVENAEVWKPKLKYVCVGGDSYKSISPSCMPITVLNHGGKLWRGTIML